MRQLRNRAGWARPTSPAGALAIQLLPVLAARRARADPGAQANLIRGAAGRRIANRGTGAACPAVLLVTSAGFSSGSRRGGGGGGGGCMSRRRGLHNRSLVRKRHL